MNPNNSEAWDRYWKDGRGAACQAGDDGLYQGVIGQRWRALFSSLDDSARILDLAAGNGALARLAADAGARPEMHCVDAAAIRPTFDVPPGNSPGPKYYPRTRNERLPFAAGMFDGCVSQYGFEYGALDESVAEVARILKPESWIHWICHWRDGDIARDAADEAGRARQLRELELPARIASLVKRQQRDGKYIADSHRRTWHLPEALQLKQGLSEGFRIARSTPKTPKGNLGLFLHNLAHLYQHRERHPVDEILVLMAECDEELLRHQQRLEALVAAALTPKHLAHLSALLQHYGLPLQDRELLREPATGRLVAIELHAGAPDQAWTAAGSESVYAVLEGARHWSDYWREGSKTTFGEGRFEQAYDDSVGEFWEARAQDLTPGARIVDLGCGNGAVIELLASLAASLERHWSLIGIDYAELEAAALADAADRCPANIELRGRTPMEATGLESASIDLACSNFGLEYGDPERSAAELARILKPGGQLAAVMHHPESRVVVQARENERAVGRLLDQRQFERLVSDLVRARFDQDAAAAQMLQGSIQQALEALQCTATGEQSYPLQVARHFLTATEPGEATLSERLAFIERFSESLRAWRGRMTAMKQAAMDDQQFEAWVAKLRIHGFTNITAGELRHRNGGLLGRTLLARKP